MAEMKTILDIGDIGDEIWEEDKIKIDCFKCVHYGQCPAHWRKGSEKCMSIYKESEIVLESLKRIEDEQKFIKELRERFNICKKIFDMAWDINNNENTKYSKDKFPKIVINDMLAVMQTLSYIIDRLDNEV